VCSPHEGRNGYRNNSPECNNRRASTHVIKKIFSCARCGLCLSSKKDLRQHRKEAHGSRTITTGEGGGGFVPKARAAVLAASLPAESATEAKPELQCEFCAKAFGSASGLSKHLKIHSGLKPFKCEVCVKSFLHSAHLKNHARIHTGEKPYQVTRFSSV
jgi:KRAB domain-containing zinc finger protein